MTKKGVKSVKRRPALIAAIEQNHDIVKGNRMAIERRLSIMLPPTTKNEVMDLIDSIIEHSTEMGIDLCKTHFDDRIKENIYRARRGK